MEAYTSKHADKMIAFGGKVNEGPVYNCGLGKGDFGFSPGEKVEGGAYAKFQRTERDRDVEFFIKNVSLAYNSQDKLTIFCNLLAQFGVLGFDKIVVNTFDVVGDIFAFGIKNNLDGKGQGVEKLRIGINSGFLLCFGIKSEIDCSNFKNKTGGAVFEDDDILDNVFDVQMFLGGGGDGRAHTVLAVKIMGWIMAEWEIRMDAGSKMKPGLSALMIYSPVGRGMAIWN
jgi:hypothetical protein